MKACLIYVISPSDIPKPTWYCFRLTIKHTTCELYITRNIVIEIFGNKLSFEILKAHPAWEPVESLILYVLKETLRATISTISTITILHTLP